MSAGRIISRVVLVAGLVVAVAAVAGTSSRRTIAADSKGGSGVSYGYQLESYRFRDRMFLRFWNTKGLSLDFDLPGYYPKQLDEARWLAGEGAIYLRAMVATRDSSGEKPAPVKILYDFRSGELLVTSALPLWRLSPGSKGTAWLTDAEFEAALAKRGP